MSRPHHGEKPRTHDNAIAHEAHHHVSHTSLVESSEVSYEQDEGGKRQENKHDKNEDSAPMSSPVKSASSGSPIPQEGRSSAAAAGAQNSSLCFSSLSLLPPSTVPSFYPAPEQKPHEEIPQAVDSSPIGTMFLGSHTIPTPDVLSTDNLTCPSKVKGGCSPVPSRQQIPPLVAKGSNISQSHPGPFLHPSSRLSSPSSSASHGTPAPSSFAATVTPTSETRSTSDLASKTDLKRNLSSGLRFNLPELAPMRPDREIASSSTAKGKGKNMLSSNTQAAAQMTHTPSVSHSDTMTPGPNLMPVPALGPEPDLFFKAEFHPEPASTSAPNPKHAAAVEAYNDHFPETPLASFDELQLVMSIDSNVMAWYKSYRVRRAAEMQVPTHLKQAGITPEDWSSTEDLRQRRKQIRAQVVEQSADLAQEYKAKLRDIRLRGRDRLREYGSPLVLAMEANVAQLDPQAKARLVAAGRKGTNWNAEELDQELALARAEWVRQAREGTLLFDPEAFPIMPL